MRHDLALVSILTVGVCALAQAGDRVVPRQQFKESTTYPFVFKPDSYLASRGPLPMRFAAAGPSCEARRPPAPPSPAKPDAAPEPSPTDAKPSAEAPPAAPPASAAPTEPPAKHEPPDFSKVPDEVLDFFKNTEGRPVRRAYLFDPIFQPVMPDELPKSKATSKQK